MHILGKQKAAERDDSEPRMNGEIMAPTVRLVIDGGVAYTTEF